MVSHLWFGMSAGCRILDNLPIGMVRMRDDGGEQVKTYERGFPVGFTDVSEMFATAGDGRGVGVGTSLAG